MECGDLYDPVANAIKPYVNSAGQISIDKLIKSGHEFEYLIASGNIQRISSEYETIGAAEYRKLVVATADPCLKGVFLSLADVCSFVSFILQDIRDPVEAAEIICNELNYEALRINSCIPNALIC